MLTRRYLNRRYLKQIDKDEPLREDSELLGDDVKGDDCGLVWPPVFPTYDEFYDDVLQLIKEHPEFGEWLKLRLGSCDALSPNSCILSKIGVRRRHDCTTVVEALKEEYVKQARLKNEQSHLLSLCAKWELERNEEVHNNAQLQYERALQLRDTQLELNKLAGHHALQSVARTHAVVKPCVLERRDRLRAVAR